MANRANLELIKLYFASNTRSVFTPTEIMQLLEEKRDTWSIPRSYGRYRFQELLQERVGLTTVVLTSSKTKPIVRFVRGEPSHLELGASLFKSAYFSHSTAATINGLINLGSPQNLVYLNREQSPKPKPTGSLSQESLDRAFANSPRISGLRYAATYGTSLVEYVVISGKHSNNLGTREILDPIAGPIKTADIERTLIDAVVRPQYVGDFTTVLNMFEKARTKVAVDKMLNILRKLDYVYPYHQTIGFLLQRAQYDSRDYDKFRAIGTNFTFYFTHAMSQPHYDPYWKIYYP